MKKITTFLLISTSSLAFVSNSFGMQKSLMRTISIPKKVNCFHTTTPNHNIFDMLIWEQAIDASAKATDNNILLQKHNALLDEIVKQNKENNDLLRAIIHQNHLLSYRQWNNYCCSDDNICKKLNNLNDTLKLKYNIELKHE